MMFHMLLVGLRARQDIYLGFRVFLLTVISV